MIAVAALGSALPGADADADADADALPGTATLQWRTKTALPCCLFRRGRLPPCIGTACARVWAIPTWEVFCSRWLFGLHHPTHPPMHRAALAAAAALALWTVASAYEILQVPGTIQWSYNDAGVPLDGTGWEGLHYNDQAWPKGLGQLGYGAW